MIRKRVVVSGRVQGVWFRESCRREAERLGVAGWVANRFDGTVEAVLEGESDAVAALVSWCHEGPKRARVEHVDVHDEPPQGERRFSVRG